MLSSGKSVRHVFTGERLQAFSDAVFAIIATLMVIPLKLKREEVEAHGGIEGYELGNFLTSEEEWSRYLVYLYSFSLVVDMWYSHVGIFSIIEQVDDVIIWLNLLCLLLVSFLPYGTGLVSTYPSSKSGEGIAITICALDLFLIGVSMFFILLYAFRRQSLLHPEIENDADIVSIRRASIISVLITPCMALLAMCFSFLTSVPYIALLLFYSIGAFSFLSRVGVYWYYKRRKGIENLPCHLFNSVGGTVRTEAFSDGLFSIVATLLVLDVTTEYILSPDELQEKFDGNLSKALNEQRYVFVAYVTSFVVVGLLWFVHYGMMHFIETISPPLNIINNMTLFLIGGIPFVSGIHTIFSDTPQNSDGDLKGLNVNRGVSIRVFCVVLFLVGIGQLLFWTVALFQKSAVMSKKVDQYGLEALQFSKIMVFPVLSFIIFWGSFSESFVSSNLFDYLLFFSPLIFLILKVIFGLGKHNLAWKRIKELKYKLTNNHVQKDSGGRRQKDVNSSVEERTTLVGGKIECSPDDGIASVPTTSTHMRLMGKREEVVVEVT